MTKEELDKSFKEYMNIFTSDPELGKIMAAVTFQHLFNPKFLEANSKFTSMDDILWRSGFGVMNFLEVENVNQDKWNAYIAKNTDCETWHDFGKLAMIEWMKATLEEVKKDKN